MKTNYLLSVAALLLATVAGIQACGSCGKNKASYNTSGSYYAGAPAQYQDQGGMAAQPMMRQGAMDRDMMMQQEPRGMARRPMTSEAVADTGEESKGGNTLADVAMSDNDFSTLVTAVKAAGLASVLKGEQPLTVFAPNNAAFAKVPKADLDALLADKAQLTAVLKYHILPGVVDSKALAQKTQVKTLQGTNLSVDATEEGIFINDAEVIKPDIKASNGVIHVIDTVLMPK